MAEDNIARVAEEYIHITVSDINLYQVAKTGAKIMLEELAEHRDFPYELSDAIRSRAGVGGVAAMAAVVFMMRCRARRGELVVIMRAGPEEYTSAFTAARDKRYDELITASSERAEAIEQELRAIAFGLAALV